MIIKVGDRVRCRSGKTGIVRALDWHEGKVVSAGVLIEDGIYKEVYHQMIHNLELI
jgi:hypothetical protein